VLAEGLKFVYEGGIEAIRGVDLRIRKGEYIAIVGGNGSGKTTLAKNLNGLLRPTSGHVGIAGMSAAEMTVAELARFVGYAFQNPDHQLFSSTVEEEVRFGPKSLGYPESEVTKKVGHALEVMDLQSVRNAPPLTLSLSYRRRVSIASVIAMDPQVIILDEPTTGLDAKDINQLMRYVDLLNREGHTLILITHDMRLVAEHAKRVLVMAAGRILLDSDPRGSFSDLDLLRQSNLEPPNVTRLAHRLSRFDIASDIFSPEELASAIVQKIRGGQ
jgi:energy-coupling factor transporter ATP-binding protein EcfA2